MNLEQKYNIFLDKNHDEFIKLYIQERLRLGIGCLFGDCSKDNNEIDQEFLNAKLTTSSIYISSILPKIESLKTIIINGDEDVLSMKQNWL